MQIGCKCSINADKLNFGGGGGGELFDFSL